MTDVSSHADHIPSHWRFPRTQSRALSSLEWESRIPALRAWGNYIAGGVAAALLALLALGWR